MKSIQKQRGMSLIGVALLAFFVIFFGLLIVKLSGSYFDQYTLDKMIQTSLEGQTSERFSEVEFKDRIQKNMGINNINLDLKTDLKVDKRKTPIQIVLDYEKRIHLFGNVDVVLMFHKDYEL